MEVGFNFSYSKDYFEITNNFLIFDNVKMIIMSKTNQEFMKQTMTGSIGGDEDYLYEQYIAQEQMNEEYWQWKSVQSHSIFPDGMEYDDEYYKSSYLPTPEEENENFKQVKQNGHT